MQDADLFLEVAAIAGVFVGFGALIAVRSGGASGAFEVGYMRSVVSIGALTIAAALAPVTVARYDLTDHEVWALSSAIVLVGYVVFIAVNARTPEYRANWVGEIDARRRGSRWLTGAYWVVYAAVVSPMVLLPIIIVLGLVPELEAALYFTNVVLILGAATTVLLGLVYAQRRSAEA